MAKRNQAAVREARNTKKEETGRVIEGKFEESRRIIPLVAKNDAQRRALKAFEEKQLVVLSGSAGAGKSEIMCWYASKLWLEGKIDNIVITRPHQHLGNDYGAVTGNDTLKVPVSLKITSVWRLWKASSMK